MKYLILGLCLAFAADELPTKSDKKEYDGPYTLYANDNPYLLFSK